MYKNNQKERIFLDSYSLYPNEIKLINATLANKIGNYIQGKSNKCITVEDVMYSFNLSNNRVLSTYKGVGVSVYLLYTEGIEKFATLFKNTWDIPDITEDKIRSLINKTIKITEENNEDFKLEVNINDINLDKGWSVIYDILFQGFTYTLPIVLSKKEGYKPVIFNCEVKSNSIKTNIDDNFDELFIYNKDRFKEINSVLQQSIEYIRHKTLLINNNSKPRGKSY